jgi:hypothetical protein
MFITDDGDCMQCGKSVAVHKVVWVDPEETPDFESMGLTDCMFETGADMHHGLWCRYLCLILEDETDTMDREDFEELYG